MYIRYNLLSLIAKQLQVFFTFEQQTLKHNTRPPFDATNTLFRHDHQLTNLVLKGVCEVEV
jgi:hypothetical protein